MSYSPLAAITRKRANGQSKYQSRTRANVIVPGANAEDGGAMPAVEKPMERPAVGMADDPYTKGQPGK
jgi:hypothetical protein